MSESLSQSFHYDRDTQAELFDETRTHHSLPPSEVLHMSHRKPVTFPMCTLILAATVLSTSASLAGGLVLYLQGIESLKESIEGVDLQSLVDTVLSGMQESTTYSEELRSFLFSKEVVMSEDHEEWANLTRTLFHVKIAESDAISLLTLQLFPVKDRGRGFFSSEVWADVNQQQSFSAFGNHVPEEQYAVLPNGTYSKMLSAIHSLDDAGHVNPHVNYMIAQRVFAKHELDLGKGIYPSFGSTPSYPAEVANADHSLWVGPRQSHFVNLVHEAFLFVHAFYRPPPLPHPWGVYESVVVTIAIQLRSFAPVFELFKVGHPDATVVLFDREGLTVLASTTGQEVIPTRCELVSETECFLHIHDMSPTIQDAMRTSANEPFGAFASRSLAGQDHFIRRHHVFSSWEIVWIRPTSAVHAKVQSALYVLIVFTCLVVLIDLSILALEMVFIALPIRHVSECVRHIGHMKTNQAKRSINKYEKAPFMIAEVRGLTLGLFDTIRYLHEMKAFLPEALFVNSVQAEQYVEKDVVRSGHPSLQFGAMALRPLGEQSGSAAMLFTDVSHSSDLWDDCVDMKHAMEIHNHVIRDCARHIGATEVKKMGDSFMYVCENIETGLTFALLTQKRLFAEEWPDTLRAHPGSVEDPSGDWSGLRIKIGIHFGPVTIQFNEVVGRYDYFGPTVNKAARLVSICMEGCIAVCTPVLWSVGDIKSKCAQVDLGSVALRGIRDQVEVSFLVPLVLPRRCSYAKALAVSGVLGNAKRKTRRGDDASSCSSGSSAFSCTSVSSVPSPLMKSGREPGAKHATVSCMGRSTQTICADSKEESTALNRTFASILTAVESCNGKVVTVFGGCVLGGWNITTYCRNHMECAFRSVYSVAKVPNVLIGMSTGLVLSGHVADPMGSQRYLMSDGHCVDSAVALLGRCAEMSLTALYACEGEGAWGIPRLKQNMRPVDRLRMFRTTMLVYEMRSSKLALDISAMYGVGESEVADGTWSEDYTNAFLHKDLQVLSSMAQTDATLLAVVERVEMNHFTPLSGFLETPTTPNTMPLL